MGEAGNGEGAKRRLPLWMSKDENTLKEDVKLENDESLKKNAGCVLSKCQTRRKRKYSQSSERFGGNNDEDGDNDIQESLVDTSVSQKKKTNKKDLKFDESMKEEFKRPSDDEEGCILRKCQSRRKRKCSRSNKKIDGNDDDEDVWESWKLVDKPVYQKKRTNKKKLKYDESMKEESEGPSDDEEDLTVEDLLNIAQEYVSANNSVERAQSLNKECGLGSRLPPVAPYKNESIGSLDVRQNNVRLDTCEASTSACNSIESEKHDINVSNMKRTGDPAQDMLDLFLGPLLKKPIREETKIVFAEDLTRSYESERKTHGALVSGELSPLTKKKSSLKEQVAMLLD